MRKLMIIFCMLAMHELAISQSYRSFELRYFSNDTEANGETDFKGETEIFDNNQRVTFLKNYATYAKKFFDDPGLDYEVVSDREAAEAATRIKPQPLPQYRRRINLEKWRWLGFRENLDTEALMRVSKYQQNSQVTIQKGVLKTVAEKTKYTWKFPSQSWRFSFSWKAKTANNQTKTAFIFSEMEKIIGAEIGFGANGKFYYTTADNELVESFSYTPNEWYEFKVEFDLAAFKREKDLVRYNLYINNELVADYVPLQRVSTGGVGYARNFTSIAKVNRLTIKSGKGTEIDDLWGVGYHLSGRESYPYSTETFLDESFELVQSIDGWQDLGYLDSLWQEGLLPIVHGGERYEAQDLLLRKVLYVENFDKAFLNIETLDPGGEVWVNGRVVAVVDNRSPQKIDITSYLIRGEENVIGIKVNHFYLTDQIGELMPHSSLDFNIGWFAGRMSLDLLPLTSINDMFVYTKELSDDNASQIATINLRNKYWGVFRGSLQMKLFPWFPMESGQLVAEKSVDLELQHDLNSVEIPFTVKNPQLWTPESPNLYKVQCILKNEEGEIIDDMVTTTGIRTVDQVGGSFRLNGKVSMLNGAQIMGYRSPLETMIKETRSTTETWIAKEIMQIKRMNGNFLRIHVHNWEFPARGINDPRYAEFADQMGIMLLWCPTAWIRTGRGWGDVDFENYPKYMKQVINHPSIVMWEAANHTMSFKGKPVSESNIYCQQVHNTLYNTDPSRIISYNSFIRHLHYGNDEGTIDQQGNAIDPGWAWTAANVTRGNQDSPTGYGKTWKVLREYPGQYRASFLNSKKRAYFNFEHQESIGQPNWNLVKGKPWYRMHSYEWGYDEGSIGRRLKIDEWEESQAWQGFSAWEAMKKMRCLDYDGFSWCCLHGGANSVTYKKPLIDFLGHAKIAWHVNKMIFQKTVGGSANVDIVIGPDDTIDPVIINWNNAKTVDMTVVVKDLNQKEVFSKTYKSVNLEEGRTVKELQSFRPGNLEEGYYYIVYDVK